MSELAIPQVRCEIFREPCFWDDNFVDGWTPEHDAEVSTDGDVVTVKIGTVVTSAAISKDAVFYAVSDRYVIVKCDVFDGTIWKVYLRKAASGSWLEAASYNSTGIKTVDLDGVTKEKCDKIRFRIDGLAGEKAEFDYVAICKKTMLIPSDTWDLLTELQITLPLLSSGVAGVNPLKFPNFDAEYTGKISPFDVVLLYLWRKGDIIKKVFGGPFVQPGTTGSGVSQEYYLQCEAVGHGHDLQVPESMFQKFIEATNGRTIIQDVLSYCSITDKFVDVDEEIESVHDFDFDEFLPFNVVNEVCRQAKTLGGVVGFDAYVDPAGNMHVFKRGKYVSSVSLSEAQIDFYDRSVDVLRVKNKIAIYGARQKNYPENKDLAESTLGWSGPSVGIDLDDKKIGTLSVTAHQASGTYIWLDRTFTPAIECDCWKKYTKFKFWLKIIIAAGNPMLLRVWLTSPDLGDCFSKTIYPIPHSDIWYEWILELGDGKGWSKTGNPTWNNITGFRIMVNYAVSQASDLKIDGPHFAEARFVGIVENKVSQAKYGVRCREPEIDEILASDAECAARAQSISDFLSEPVTKFTTIVEGDNRYRSGDKLYIPLSNDNINDWFRIIEVLHVIRGVDWNTHLTVSNEPEYIDYVFAMTGPPRNAGATVVAATSEGEDVDFTSIQQAIDVIAA